MLNNQENERQRYWGQNKFKIFDIAIDKENEYLARQERVKTEMTKCILWKYVMKNLINILSVLWVTKNRCIAVLKKLS